MVEPGFLLDSNACIYVLEGLSSALRDRIEARSPGEIVTSAIVYAEVMRGIDPLNEVAVGKTLRLFEAFPALPFDAEAARVYARVPFRRGKFDRLIGAHALALGLTVITSNEADFADIPGLRVENWTI